VVEKPRGRRGDGGDGRAGGGSGGGGPVDWGAWRGVLATAAALAIDVDTCRLGRLERYAGELRRFGGAFNLGAREAGAVAPEAHCAVSLGVFAVDRPRPGERVVDIGSGAGFPGLVVKIVRPDLDLTLVEAGRRRALFLEHVARVLGLEGVRVLARRAEDLGGGVEWRGAFDLALARAFGPFEVTCEVALPLLRVGGRLVAYRGPRAEEEAHQAEAFVAELGGRVGDIMAWAPAGEPGVTPLTLVTVHKEGPTPDRYPRRAARLGR